MHWRNPRRVRRRASGRSVYNYRRDYDPAIGRYIESDPIGLAGGSYSTYAYASGNPISLTDPLGLMGGGGGGSAAHPGPVCDQSAPRLPDFISFNINAYVFSVYGAFASNGYAFVGGGVNFNFPNPLSLEASANAGWLNVASPTGAQIDNFLGGYSGGVTGGYVGLGGGEVWSPGNGTATVIGFGAGASFGSSSNGGGGPNWGYGVPTGSTGIKW
jgi:RHS repeat-associated protein